MPASKNLPPLVDRFMARVKKDPSGCWLWQGAINWNGYAQFYDGVNQRGAHRWAYAYFREPIPKGLEIDHLCNNRHCVNPEHLDAVTRQENQRRAAERNTHCPRGHRYVHLNSKGYKVCNVCAAERARKRRASN